MKTLIRNRYRLFAILLVAFAIVVVLEVSPTNQKAQVIDRGETYSDFAGSDAATEVLRNPGFDLVRIRVDANTRNTALREGTLIADYGSSIVVARRNDSPEINAALEPIELDTKVNLPGGSFEPLVDKGVPGAASQNGKAFFVVQIGFPVNDEIYKSIEDAGVDIVQYVPHNSYLVYGEESSIEKIRNHKRVRWVGRYLAEHKLPEITRRAADDLGGGSGYFDVAVYKGADFASEYSKIASIGSRILSAEKPPVGFFDLIAVELNKAQLDEVAGLEHVLRIDQFVKPVAEDERAAQIVAGNYSNTTTINAPGYDPATQFGTDGSNVTVAISDDGVSIPGNGGFYVTSGNTVDGPLRGATTGAGGGHGHINASIVAGSTPFGTLDPTGYNYGRGVAPGAHIINIPFLKSGNTTTDSQSVSDTVLTAGPNGVNGSIINNSWGAGTNGNAYDSRAALWDTFAFDASIGGGTDPINVVFSAGNSGSNGLTRPKMAKNVIAVGNSENIRTELHPTSANNMDDMRSSSSRGPAADGRIKPDITAPGSYIAGSRGGSGGSVSGHIDANHSYSIGTSHAAPQIAGVAALFTKFWKDNNAGALPKPALVKAAILNTGQEMNGVGSSNPLPNGDEGWGRANLGQMFNTGVPMLYRNETDAFSNPGEVLTINSTIGDGSKPLRIALVWSDPPGVSDPALVNNLDLTVTIGGNAYLGNVFSGGLSTTGGTADTVNNVEIIHLPAGTATGTPVQVQVSATTINGDGIPGNADSTDQTLALVGYNLGTPVAPPNNADFDYDGDNKTDLSIFRPGPGQWWIQNSQAMTTFVTTFGVSTDVLVPEDFTGDGKDDIAFFRPASGEWFVLRSEDNSFFSFPFGANGDIPAPGDYDGDGKADAAVFRPASATWFINNSGGGVTTQAFGLNGDQPVPQDYDGDGKDDLAIYRPSVSEWFYQRSSDLGVLGFAFGTNGDRALPSDFTGDGKADIAFFRPSAGQWFVLRSEDSTFFAFPFGTGTDIPAPGDYDGDGKTDAAVFRPSSATWFINGTTAGPIIQAFGATGDIPTPNAYVR